MSNSDKNGYMPAVISIACVALCGIGLATCNAPNLAAVQNAEPDKAEHSYHHQKEKPGKPASDDSSCRPDKPGKTGKPGDANGSSRSTQDSSKAEKRGGEAQGGDYRNGSTKADGTASLRVALADSVGNGTATRGSDVEIEVSLENLTSEPLSEYKMRVQLPEQVDFVDSQGRWENLEIPAGESVSRSMTIAIPETYNSSKLDYVMHIYDKNGREVTKIPASIRIADAGSSSARKYGSTSQNSKPDSNASDDKTSTDRHREYDDREQHARPGNSESSTDSSSRKPSRSSDEKKNANQASYAFLIES